MEEPVGLSLVDEVWRRIHLRPESFPSCRPVAYLNRDYYSDIDPYHCTEYSYHQYVALMKCHFSEVEVEATGHHLYALIHAEPGP